MKNSEKPENAVAATNLPDSPLIESDDAESSGECYYNGWTYSNGSINCLNGKTYRCQNGSWIGTGTNC